MAQRARVGQAARAGLWFKELSNGFASCDDPAALQEICGRLGPGQIRVFAGRWQARLPLPSTRVGRQAGYWRDISMRRAETASTITFTAPRHARAFFEAPAAGNPGIGRPGNMEIIFNRQVRPAAKGVIRTAAGRDNDGVVADALYQHSGSRPASRTAGRWGERPSSTTPATSACGAASSTSTS